MNRTIKLNTGREMPLLGIGTYKMLGQQVCNTAIHTAVQNGYHLIDTASAYKNEEEVGRAIARCGLPRQELFITSKIWNTAQRLGDVQGSFDRSLERMRLDYVDLYLVHWPVPGCYISTYTQMEKFLSTGRAKAIGVSNFAIRHLKELKSATGIIPAINQIECHPLNYNKELIDYCQEEGIVVQAYSPLARGAYFDTDIICVLATKYGRTPGQIGLRWLIQKGISPLPKANKADHIISNAQIFDFELLEDEMAIIDTMNENRAVSGVPEDLRNIPF